MKRTGKNKPSLITEGVRIRSFWYVNIEETQDENGEWTWEAIPLDPGGNRKDQIITKIVEYKYPTDKISGVLQSYLSASEDLSVRWEYEALQAWKTEATKIADKVIEAINEHESDVQ